MNRTGATPMMLRIAERNLAVLRIKCTMGVFSDRLFRSVIRGSDECYPLEKLDWMRGCLRDRNQNIAASCLECLCVHGARLSEFEDVIRERFEDRMFGDRAIMLAERQRDSDMLYIFLQAGSGYVNRAVLAAKAIGCEDSLVELILTSDDDTARALLRIAGKKNNAGDPPEEERKD